MQNHLNQHSIPLKEETTKLATIFTLNPRNSKKGRLWIPILNKKYPLKFKTKFAYISKILEKDNISGNHYHNIKEEIIMPLTGTFEIHLEDINTKEKEQITLNSKNNKAIYIKTKISHKLVSKEPTGIILVLASSQSSPEDEIKYIIK